MSSLNGFISLAASCLLVTAPAWGQHPGRLRIIPLEGNNAVNYLQAAQSVPPVVEVRDLSDRPVEGAVVEFRLPRSGPGAAFANGALEQKGITDFRGQVGVKDYAANAQTGRFTIEVIASWKDATARTVLTQLNSNGPLPLSLGGPPKSSKKWRWIALTAAVGAGAAVGIYLGTRSTPGPIGVSVGPVAVGGIR